MERDLYRGERKAEERLPLISLKLDLVDLLEDNALPVSLAYMYTPLPYVSKASYKADEERIKSLEAKIIKGGSDEERAVKAIAEAKEYLEIVAGSRVRDNSKCLVF